MTWTRINIEVDVDGDWQTTMTTASRIVDRVLQEEDTVVIAATARFDGEHGDACDGRPGCGCDVGVGL